MIPGIDGIKKTIPGSNTAIGVAIMARYDRRTTLRLNETCVAFSLAVALANHFLDGGRCSSIAETRKGKEAIAKRIEPNAQIMAVRPRMGTAESRMKLRTHVRPRYSSTVSNANQTAIAIDDNEAKTALVAPIRNMAAIRGHGLDSESVSFSFEGMFPFSFEIIFSIIP